MLTFDNHADAVAACGETEVVCACQSEGAEAKYFVLPADTDQETLAMTSFEIMRGRPMTEPELFVLRAGLLRKEQDASP